MNNKEKPFWELGLNPITMLKPNDHQFKHQMKIKSQKNSVINQENIKYYATLAEFKEAFNLTGFKIRQILIGLEAKEYRHLGQTYFERKR